jgi:hypothetical protein
VTLRLATLFPDEKWSDGDYLLEAEWNTANLTEATGAKFTLGASMAHGGHDSFRIARMLAQVHAVRGVELRLVDGLQFEFVAHGHKRTLEGDTSPLILAARLGPKGALKECNVNIDLPQRIFTLCGHQFLLVKHSYGEWMDLEYYGRTKED